MLEQATLARNLDLSKVPSLEDAAPILGCVFRKETHNQHSLCLQPIALVCDVPLMLNAVDCPTFSNYGRSTALHCFPFKEA